MGPYMYVVLAFIGGVVVGALFCFFGFPKLMPNHRMQDELTRSKRELATVQRALEEYLLRSTSLFAELDKKYQQYAQFVQEAAGRISHQDGSFLQRTANAAEDTEVQQVYDSANLLRQQNAREEAAVTEDQTVYQDAAEPAQTELQPLPAGADMRPERAVEISQPALTAEAEQQSELQDTVAEVPIHEEVRLESAVEDVNAAPVQQKI